MTVVNSPMMNLAAIGRLDLLRQLYGTVLIPEAVYDEVAGQGTGQPGSVEAATLPWIAQRALTDQKRRQRLQQQLDTGEAGALALAMELKADGLVIDELAGREVARHEGLRFTGVIDVLLEAKQCGLLTAIKPEPRERCASRQNSGSVRGSTTPS